MVKIVLVSEIMIPIEDYLRIKRLSTMMITSARQSTRWSITM